MPNDNDKKIAAYKKQRTFKIIYIVLSIIVIILELLAIFNVISMIWGCVVFAIIYLFKKNILK